MVQDCFINIEYAMPQAFGASIILRKRVCDFLSVWSFINTLKEDAQCPECINHSLLILRKKMGDALSIQCFSSFQKKGARRSEHLVLY